MSWRDRYRTGSWRGVPFRTQTGESEGGRRVETHEYPGRDRPWSEDLGRRARRATLEAFVAGTDYLDARDRLIAALDAGGSGTLVHPWDGSMIVSVTEWTCRDSTDEGGVAYFTITFVEAGAAAAPAVQADTAEISRATAAATQAAVPSRFAGRFDVAGTLSFVEDAGERLVQAAAAQAAIAGGLQGGVGPALRAFDAGLHLLPASARTLLRNPLQLGQSIVGVVHAIGALGGSSLARIAGLSRLVAFRAAPVIGATPARAREAANADAFVDLVTTAAGAELVRAIADAPIASYQEAVALRAASAELIERRLVEVADAGDDAAATTWRELLRVLVADVTARGGTLARVYDYRPLRTEPALVIAARLYGAGDGLAARVDDLVARNRVRHPGFVPGGATIEVLEASGG